MFIFFACEDQLKNNKTEFNPYLNTTESLLQINPEGFTVDITKINLDSVNDEIELTMDVIYPSGDEKIRMLNLKMPKPGGNLDYYIQYSLSDKNHNSLFSFRYEWENKLPYHLQFIEKAKQESLIIDKIVKDVSGTTQIEETYHMSSDSFTMVYDSVGTDSLKTVWNQYINGENMEDPMVKMAEEYDEFYDWNHSVNNNVDGELLSKLQHNETLTKWLDEETEQHGGFDDTINDNFFDFVCFSATACTFAKCPFGWAGNPVCVGCGVVTIICCLAGSYPCR